MKRHTGNRDILLSIFTTKFGGRCRNLLEIKCTKCYLNSF